MRAMPVLSANHSIDTSAHIARIRPIVQNIIFAIERSRLKGTAFAVISNNCWGYEIYRALRVPYNSPFVGLFLFPGCYIRLLEEFETCVKSNLRFADQSKYIGGSVNYPIGFLCNEVEIHFLHYSSKEQASEKWKRRMVRLRKAMEADKPFFVKFCDRDGCTAEHIAKFHSLPFPNKLSIGIGPFNAAGHLYQPRMKDPTGPFVLDGLKLYEKRYHYFDISYWLSKGIVCRTLLSRIFALMS